MAGAVAVRRAAPWRGLAARARRGPSRRTRALARIAGEARARVAAVEPVVPDRAVLGRLRRAALRDARRAARFDALAVPVASVLGVVSVLGSLGAVAAAAARLVPGADAWDVLTVWGIAMAAAVGPAAARSAVAGRLGLPEPSLAWWAAAGLVAGPGLAWWALSPAASDLAPWPRLAVAAAGACWVVVIVAGTAMLLAVNALARLLARSRDAIAGEEVAALLLLGAVAEVDGPAAWSNGQRRVAAAEHVRRAVVAVERGLPVRLHGNDAVANEAVRQRCRRAAAGLRGLQVPLLVPGSGTPEAFRAGALGAADALLAGLIDDLPSADPPSTRGMRATVSTLGRSCLVALLPAIGIAAVDLSPVDFAGAAAGYAWAAAAGWAAVVALTALDPRLDERLAAFREAWDAVRR